ncbi:MAG: hypothetical protein ABGZ24_16370, partial [Fuerstiella sp.]
MKKEVALSNHDHRQSRWYEEGPSKGPQQFEAPASGSHALLKLTCLHGVLVSGTAERHECSPAELVVYGREFE